MSSSVFLKNVIGFSLLRRVTPPTGAFSVRQPVSSQAKQELVQQKDTAHELRRQQVVTLRESNAAQTYLRKVEDYEKFMKKEWSEFDIGRRHLANMMGEDPATFTQQDINRSIQYLFPSALFHLDARPMMLPPDEVFAGRKEAQFDMSGRPYHTLFYTNQPYYYQTMHDITAKVKVMDRYRSKMQRQTSSVEIIQRLELGGTVWVSKHHLQKILMEKLRDNQYEQFIMAMDRLAADTYSHNEKEFIMNFRKPLETKLDTTNISEPQTGADGLRFAFGVGTAKRAKAIVKVIEGGSGHYSINGKSILYFDAPQQREQIVHPLIVCGLLGKVDIICEVFRSGITAQANAIRYATAVALRSLVDSDTTEKMRIAGLLTLDLRRRERKKPGQLGARAKFTWKKR